MGGTPWDGSVISERLHKHNHRPETFQNRNNSLPSSSQNRTIEKEHSPGLNPGLYVSSHGGHTAFATRIWPCWICGGFSGHRAGDVFQSGLMEHDTLAVIREACEPSSQVLHPTVSCCPRHHPHCIFHIWSILHHCSSLSVPRDSCSRRPLNQWRKCLR